MSRPTNPESRRQRALLAGVPESTLRRRERGAKPRKPAPVVERCPVLDAQCEVSQ